MTDKDLTPENDEPNAQPEDLESDVVPVEDVVAQDDDTQTDAESDATVIEMVEAVETSYVAEPSPDVEEFESAPVYASAALTEPSNDDWMTADVDAALAAVATLSEIMPQREAEAEARADARQSKPTFTPEMKLPPLTTLRRGSLGSIIPALLLIGLGAWLTLTTTSGAAIDPQLLALVIVGGVVVTLLAHWLGTGRWARGAFFFALLILLVAGVVVYSVQPNGIDLARGYPLLVVALGLAVALSGLLARPVSAKMLAPGVLLVAAGLVALAVTLNLVPPDLLTVAAPFAPVVLIVVLILWLLPLVFRRRRS